MENKDPKITRITADFSPEAYAVLGTVAERLNTSKADVLRRSLGLFSFVLDLSENGGKVIFEEKDGKTKEMIPFMR